MYITVHQDWCPHNVYIQILRFCIAFMVRCTSPCIYCKRYQTRIRYWTGIWGSMWGGAALYGPHGWLQRFDARLVDFPSPFTGQFPRALLLYPWWRTCASWKRRECDGSYCTRRKHAAKVATFLCTAEHGPRGYAGHSRFSLIIIYRRTPKH